MLHDSTLSTRQLHDRLDAGNLTDRTRRVTIRAEYGDVSELMRALLLTLANVDAPEAVDVVCNGWGTALGESAGVCVDPEARQQQRAEQHEAIEEILRRLSACSVDVTLVATRR